MQVPQLQLSGQDLPIPVEGVLAQELRQACTQELHQAVQLLLGRLDHISLCCSSESGCKAWERSFYIAQKPEDEELAMAYIEALVPLAPWLKSVFFVNASFIPGLIAVMVCVLVQITTVGLGGKEWQPELSQALWQLVLYALPSLAAINRALPEYQHEPELCHLGAACKAMQRVVSLELVKELVQETATVTAAFGSEWLHVRV